jgi:uncharacterized protein (TIRG00374 family)
MTSAELSPEPVEPPIQRWGILLLKVGISFLALYLTWRLLAGLDWHELAGRLAEASWFFLTPAILLLLARWAAWDWRFRLAAREAVGLSPGTVLGYFVLKASAALNLITPSARLIGGLMRARYFSRAAGLPFGVLYGVVLYDQVAHHVVMSTATWIALIATARAVGRTGLSMAAAIVLVALATGLVLWSRRGRFETNPLVRLLARRAERAEGRMQRFYSHGHEAVHVFVRLLGSPSLHLRAALLGALYVVFNVGAQWMVFLAMGQPIDLLVVFVGVSLGVAAGTLTGTPGGLGTTEAAMVASFAALGVDRVDAAAGTLLFRGLHYATVLGLGLPALLVLEFRLPQTPAEVAGEEG